ncbi:MAG: GNAT family N-acetyltransferase [Sedimentisphaerales bacterium]
MKISEMKISDYDEVFSLWKKTEGIGLHKDADSRKGIARYLRQNPGLSLVARENKKIVGDLLCGQDGRRGHLYHLAVAPPYRKKGIGKALVNQALSNLAAIGFNRCTLCVFAKNRAGRRFWKRTGWIERPDIIMMAKDTGKENARKK